MDLNTRKTTLRMIPYGLYVLTAGHPDGRVAAATVNWVTQASFEPPLVAVGIKADYHVHALINDTKAFALNLLGKGQQTLAFTFFKPAERQGETISGDHSIFVGRVIEVGLTKPPGGRADDATLWLKDRGEKVFYGG